MKNIEAKRELHCPEVREILDKSPSWIIRWGTLVITLAIIITALIIWLGFF
jgi:hypothetical protein